MAKLVWDAVGSRFYETGVRRGVLYPMNDSGAYGVGVAWNGLTGVTESPSGADVTKLYANDGNYLTLYAIEEFGGTIEAYTYPPEFAACNGELQLAKGLNAGQQDRVPFGFSYRTALGNDIKADSFGYKLHIVYGAKAAPSERQYATVNDSPEAMKLSWEITTTPVDVPGGKPTSLLTINSSETDVAKLKALEDILYGAADVEARLPLPEEVITLLSV